MSYVGGKARKCDHILSMLNNPSFDGMDYLEPFVGYGHILRRIAKKKSYTASDANELLIALLKGIQNRQVVPSISEKEYLKLKHDNKNKSFRRAVAAFAYSYKGMQFTGYFDKRRGRSYADEQKRYYRLLQDNEQFRRTRLKRADYASLNPSNVLIYCDPPYANTTGYNQGDRFDNNKFWSVMRQWSKKNIVFVSEYKAPPDFKCVACCKKYNQLSPTGNPSIRMERLFVHSSIAHKIPTGTTRIPKGASSKIRPSRRPSR